MKKKRGHYCKICGDYKANEKVSGKGYAQHICKAFNYSTKFLKIIDINGVYRAIIPKGGGASLALSQDARLIFMRFHNKYRNDMLCI